MPAYNFQQRFMPAILSGIKRSTIRARRKDRRDAKPGQTLYLFTGMRTKKCLRLGKSVCKSVEPINVIQRKAYFSIRVRGRTLIPPQLTDLWVTEGFRSLDDMLRWFRSAHGPNFTGLLIKW